MSVLLQRLQAQWKALREAERKVSKAIQSERLRIALEDMAGDTELMKALKIQQEDS